MANQLKTSWRLTCVMSIVGVALSCTAEQAIAQESRDTYLGFRLIRNMGAEEGKHGKGVRTVLFPVGLTILSSGQIRIIPPMTVGYAWDDTSPVPYPYTVAGTSWLKDTQLLPPVTVLSRPFAIEVPSVGIKGLTGRLDRGSDIVCKGCKIPGRYLALPWGRSDRSTRFYGPPPVKSGR